MNTNNKINLFDYSFKIVLVGNQSVGKTSLIERIVHNKYNNIDVPTIGVEFQAKIFTISNGKRIKCQVWDTAGQEAFAPIIKTYFRGSAGVMVCFDVTDPDSFRQVKKWINSVRPSVPLHASWIIIGTKLDQGVYCDLERIENYAIDNSMNFVTCSSCTNVNCENILHILSEDIYTKIDNSKRQTGITSIELSKSRERQCEQVELTDCGGRSCFIS